jgi:hypothetical protein
MRHAERTGGQSQIRGAATGDQFSPFSRPIVFIAALIDGPGVDSDQSAG